MFNLPFVSRFVSLRKVEYFSPSKLAYICGNICTDDSDKSNDEYVTYFT